MKTPIVAPDNEETFTCQTPMHNDANAIEETSSESKGSQIIQNLITVENLAVSLGFAPQTIRNWVAKRTIPFVRIGGKTKFLKKSIEAWLERKEFKPWR